MMKKHSELEMGDKVIDLISTYKIPLLKFALEMVFSTPRYSRVRITMDYSPENLVSQDVFSQRIDFVAMASDLANVIHSFALPTDMFGLTIFVNNKNFDILAKKNPAIAERDVLGRIEKEDSKLTWYIQIIRSIDATKPNQSVA